MAKAKRQGTIWSHVAYVPPQRQGRGTGQAGLSARLRYFQYRDDRHTRAPQGGRRWVDHGLGSDQHSIAAACQARQSADRLAYTLVLSPDPVLWRLLADETTRRDVLCDLTEAVMARWHEEGGLGEPCYAYVLHDRATNQDGFQQLHTHVVMPGSRESGAGREKLVLNREQVRLFNQVAEQELSQLMEQTLGPDWQKDWENSRRAVAASKAVPSTSEATPPPLESDDLAAWFS